MNFVKKALVFLAVFIMSATAILPTMESDASAEIRRQLNQLQQERNQIRQQVQEAENALTGMRTEIEDLLGIMREYSQRTMDLSADLAEVEITLQETELLISYYELMLYQASADRDAHEELFLERIRAMHEQGPVGYLNVLFQATSFTDFLIRLEHVRDIAQFDQNVLDNMVTAEERVADTVAELSSLRPSLLRLQSEVEEARDAIAEAYEGMEAVLALMRADEYQANLLYELEREGERQILELLGAVEVQLRTAEAEEARVRREAEIRRQQEAANARLASLNNFDGQFAWPVPTHSHVSSPFGSRRSPISGRNEHHSGIDIPAPAGTRIVAAADGYVRLSGWNGGFGNTVIIDHGNGYSTLYGHNSFNRVVVGQRVTRGQHIADVGTTGLSTGNHLHFEIRRNGVPVNPMPFFGR